MSDSPTFTSTRHDGWTPDRQRGFIAALAEHGGIAAAARAVGMTPQSARKLRTRPGAESFAQAWDLALLMGRDRSFEEAVRRGRDGWLKPIMYKGKLVGHHQVFNDRLLLAACYAQPPRRL